MSHTGSLPTNGQMDLGGGYRGIYEDNYNKTHYRPLNSSQ